MKLVSLLLLFCGLLPLFTSALVDEEIANEEMSASSPQQRKLVVEQITDTTDTSLPLANHHQNQQQTAHGTLPKIRNDILGILKKKNSEKL